MAYINTNILPNSILSALLAIINTEDSAGPTHGVHAKLNKNPMTNATIGFILLGLIFIFSFFSFCKDLKFIIFN